MTIRLEYILDKLTALYDVLSEYVSGAMIKVLGKAVVALLIAGAIGVYAHKLGYEKGARSVPPVVEIKNESVVKNDADDVEQKTTVLLAELEVRMKAYKCSAATVREEELAKRLSEVEAVKAGLEKKVSDYEQQQAKRRKD